jgi:hypothetical protein
MRKTLIALAAGAGTLLMAATPASAQTLVDSGVYYGSDTPAVMHVGQVCDDMGRCKEEGYRYGTYNSYEYAPGYTSYNYAPDYYEPRYYGRRYYREPTPGIYVRTPAFSFGVGGW